VQPLQVLTGDLLDFAVAWLILVPTSCNAFATGFSVDAMTEKNALPVLASMCCI